jgi:predicted DNA binding CopG/RHH family protein
MKANKTERKILESVERGEWRSAQHPTRGRTRYQRYAKAHLQLDRRITIRISSRDLAAIKRRAGEEQVPYQTLISRFLHAYARGRLRQD